MTSEYHRTLAADRDQADSLARFRHEFYVPPDQIYLDGNSLGLLSIEAERALLSALEDWKQRAIGGWLEATPAWLELAEHLGARLAPLIGASADEVVVANSTTVNLHQLLATFYETESAATVVLADELSFPTDRYALESFLRRVDRPPAQHARFVPSHDGFTLSEDALIAAMTPDVQLVILPAVVYTSGQLLDLPRLARAAHERGARIGFDCSHSVGAVPHNLDRDDVDFAFFCTYKYLNGGPGSPAAIYLNRRHFGRPAGLAGWFGSDKQRQFEMATTFHQAQHAGGLQLGTPSILAAAPLSGAIELIEKAGIEVLRAKSLRLTEFLRELVDQRLEPFGFRCITPSEPARRGGHIALRHPNGQQIADTLGKHGVVVDFRPPDLIRLAPVALYTSFRDCCRAIEILEQIMKEDACDAGITSDTAWRSRNQSGAPNS